jgi:hypothetical protein
MNVTLIKGGIGAKTVEIAFAIQVINPDALATGEDDI